MRGILPVMLDSFLLADDGSVLDAQASDKSQVSSLEESQWFNPDLILNNFIVMYWSFYADCFPLDLITYI
jgi:hypothetical protein